MEMKDLTIEYETGKVRLTEANLLLEDLDDMVELEFWENKLERLRQPFVVAFRKTEGKFKYSLFTNLKGSKTHTGPFKV